MEEEGSRESEEDVGSSGARADGVAAERVRDWPVGRARSRPGSCGCWTPRGSWRYRSSWRSCGGWMRGRRQSYSRRSDPPGAWRMEAGVGVCAMCCPLTHGTTQTVKRWDGIEDRMCLWAESSQGILKNKIKAWRRKISHASYIKCPAGKDDSLCHKWSEFVANKKINESLSLLHCDKDVIVNITTCCMALISHTCLIHNF